MVPFLLLTLLQTPSLPPPDPAPQQVVPYKAVEPTNVDVQSALKFAVGEQKKLTQQPVSLVGIVTAEKAAVAADNYRVCLFADRNGVTERAQVVVSRDAKKKWSVDTWSWGSCR